MLTIVSEAEYPYPEASVTISVLTKRHTRKEPGILTSSFALLRMVIRGKEPWILTPRKREKGESGLRMVIYGTRYFGQISTNRRIPYRRKPASRVVKFN
jgi:hypothetical protein